MNYNKFVYVSLLLGTVLFGCQSSSSQALARSTVISDELKSPSPQATLDPATPNSETLFPDSVVRVLSEAYSTADPSTVNPRSAIAFATMKSGVATNYNYEVGGDSRVFIQSVFPDETKPFRTKEYLYWQDSPQSVSVQELGNNYSGFLDLYEYQPRDAIVRENNGMIEMGIIPQPIGATADAEFELLRLENDKWKNVWSSGDQEQSPQWASSEGRVEFVNGDLNKLRLVGPLPDDINAPRIFIEFGVFEKQQFDSIWERQADRYVRVSGKLIDSPLTALSNLIVALKANDQSKALGFATNSKVLADATRLNLDKIVPNTWYAYKPEEQQSSLQNILSLAPTNQGPERFTVHFVQKENHWLVDKVESP